MSKFKVGDVVVRTEAIQYFIYGEEPVTITWINEYGDLYFKNEEKIPDGGWLEDYFQLVKPQSQPMQPLVSIYDKALDLRFTHDKLGDVSLREFYCNLLCNAVVNGKELTEDVLPTEVLSLLMQNDIAAMPEVGVGIYDVSEAEEFISKMIAHAFGCSFNEDK